MELHAVTGDRLTARDVYDIWQIRDVVFGVEQRVDVADVDGLDLLPGTTHMWFADTSIASYLRVYPEDGVRHLGRVCTRRDRRGQGLSSQLLAEAHARWGSEDIAITAQAYLEDWYASLGYVRTGPNFLEAGIDHLPMRRQGTQPSA
jgi:ElaA protein